MKKWISLFIMAGLMFCACSAKNDTEKMRMPEELEDIKNSFSAIYRGMLLSESGEVIKTDSEEESVAVTAGFSFGTANHTDKNYYYLKECLKLMEKVRLKLSADGVSQEQIAELDSAINHLGHRLNADNPTETMKALNDGIYIIGAISDYYGKGCKAYVLRLEYCLNLLEIEAANPDGFNGALKLTEKVLSELASSTGEKCIEEINELFGSVESLRDAASYSDAQLVRIKVEIMRDNLKEISFLTDE